MRKFINSGDKGGLYDGFNVAASIKMRKSAGVGLLCGAAGNKLQCGRIYKDAEIRSERAYLMGTNSSFNVAASIKMRKSTAPSSRGA